MPKYFPVDSLKAPKFCGVRTFMRLPHVQATPLMLQRRGRVYQRSLAPAPMCAAFSIYLKEASQ